jgi:hypothetical protein
VKISFHPLNIEGRFETLSTGGSPHPQPLSDSNSYKGSGAPFFAHFAKGGNGIGIPVLVTCTSGSLHSKTFNLCTWNLHDLG